jgi:hypothetical protein
VAPVSAQPVLKISPRHDDAPSPGTIDAPPPSPSGDAPVLRIVPAEPPAPEPPKAAPPPPEPDAPPAP